MSNWLDSAQQKCFEYRELMLAIQGFCRKQAKAYISGEQALILVSLVEVDTCKMGDIPYAGSNVSYNIAKLTSGGFIDYSISGQDARVRYVSLTDKGKKLAREIIRHFEDSRVAA